MYLAAEKERRVDIAISRIEEAETIREVNNIERAAYRFARGSNVRKHRLWAAADRRREWIEHCRERD